VVVSLSGALSAGRYWTWKEGREQRIVQQRWRARRQTGQVWFRLYINDLESYAPLACDYVASSSAQYMTSIDNSDHVLST